MWLRHQYLNFIPTDVLLWHPMFFLISQRSAFVSKKCYSTWNASRHSTAGRWRGLKNSPLISSGRAGAFELSRISAACLSFSCAFNNRFSAIMPSSSLNSTDRKSNSDRMSLMCFLRQLLYRTYLRACGVASTPLVFIMALSGFGGWWSIEARDSVTSFRMVVSNWVVSSVRWCHTRRRISSEMFKVSTSSRCCIVLLIIVDINIDPRISSLIFSFTISSAPVRLSVLVPSLPLDIYLVPFRIRSLWSVLAISLKHITVRDRMIA